MCVCVCVCVCMYVCVRVYVCCVCVCGVQVIHLYQTDWSQKEQYIVHALCVSSCSYNLMLECWKVPPNERPQFATMRQSLEKVLCDMYPYIEVEPALQQSP